MSLNKVFAILFSLIIFLFFMPANAGSHENVGEISFASRSLNISFPAPHSIIQFFRVGSDDDERVEIHLLIPHGNGYKNAYLATIEREGGMPYIESVFLHDIGGDTGIALFIVTRWEIRHPVLDTEGNYYRTYVYSKQLNGDVYSFTRVTFVENKIGSGLDGTREGISVRYPYRDAASIRNLLKAEGL